MCEKCIQIEHTIERYRHITRSISDDLTVDRAKEVIVDLEAQKAALHIDSEPTCAEPDGMGNDLH
jgi:hypothetical protein